MSQTMTPREIISELDRYIVGQHDAKRAVAIALRNRWRRQQVASPMREEITPKNILLIGPTGVGKTEIARRLAHLANSPFIKVEATKFTEVGYVGRDVETIIRDLIDTSIKIVREEHLTRVQARAEKMAEERLLDILIPHPVNPNGPVASNPSANSESREKMRHKLRLGELDNRQVEIEVEQTPNTPMMQVFPNQGGDNGMDLQEMLGSMMSKQHKPKRMNVADAKKIIQQQEADRLLDEESVKEEAIRRAENDGIVFLDEMDKITHRGGASGGEVSREGVQRDLLPLVEGTTVNTRYGHIQTDHILFIASGAFHLAKPSDLIPELQGRFPIRVNLTALGEDEFRRILVEPESSLTRQYEALLQTENINITFTDEGIAELARIAVLVNEKTENIGARRLHTLLERVLEDISFEAPDRSGQSVEVDAAYVLAQLGEISADEDLSRYIL
ncbi:MAG: ATP-dependent protease ATPase subunit HslU [Mariprofundus sp.]